MNIEIIASTVNDCINIEKGGANRIELVSALSEGGLTPSIGMIKKSIESVKIPIAVMIRSISDSFYYDKMTLKTMKDDIEIAVKYGARHIVTGMLNAEGYPDMDALNYILSDINQDINITFHRAIDSSMDVIKSLEIINSNDRITHILTSGGEGKAIDNIDIVEKMINTTSKTIVIGSGVKSSNVRNFYDRFRKHKNFDLHIGTDMRYSQVHAPVDSELVTNLVNILS